jgi:hypothetical protein
MRWINNLHNKELYTLHTSSGVFKSLILPMCLSMHLLTSYGHSDHHLGYKNYAHTLINVMWKLNGKTYWILNILQINGLGDSTV